MYILYLQLYEHLSTRKKIIPQKVSKDVNKLQLIFRIDYYIFILND